MSTDIDCTSEIRCDRRPAPSRAFRACRVIYNFHEISTRRSRMPGKPRYSRNFANLATMGRLKKSPLVRVARRQFAELIKRERARSARISYLALAISLRSATLFNGFVYCLAKRAARVLPSSAPRASLKARRLFAVIRAINHGINIDIGRAFEFIARR